MCRGEGDQYDAEVLSQEQSQTIATIVPAPPGLEPAASTSQASRDQCESSE